MRTLRAARTAAPRAGLRNHPPWLSAFAASTTLPLVIRAARRHRDREAHVPTSVATPAGPRVAPRSPADAPAGFNSTCVTRIDDPAPTAAAAITAGRQEQSGYGLGFDQHSAHGRGRPIAWIVVAVAIAGTCASGISLILAAPLLFWTGLGVVIVGLMIGRATHAMRDEMAPLPGASRRGQDGRPGESPFPR